MIIASRIKQIRELKGLKQHYVAQKLGITQQAYSANEKEMGNKKINQLQKVAEVLEVDVCLFFAYEIPINTETVKLKFELGSNKQILP